MDDKKEKYALWLRPMQKQIDQIMKIISQLAHRKKGTPFPPHITLSYGFEKSKDELLESCEKISKSFNQFSIYKKQLGYKDEFYKNLYIEMKTDFDLMRLYNFTCKELNYRSDEEYMPHISLYYGDLNLETKKQICSDLENDIPEKFQLERLDLYECSGSIMQWYLVETFEFNKL